MLVRYQQGRLDELAPLIVDVAAQNPGIPAYQACVGMTHLEAGEHEEALEMLERGAADGFASVKPDSAWFDAMAIYSALAIELRAVEPAKRLVALITPYRDQIPFQGLTIHEPISYYLGALLAVLGREQEATGCFEQSLELCARGNMRFAEAQTQLAWGRMLATSESADDRQRARTLLEKACATAKARSYSTIARRADQAMQRLEAAG